MIPYDDLVAALSAWRARQGLPVSTLGGAGSEGTPSPGSGPHAAQSGSGPYGQPGSGPYGQPGSGPSRAVPPAPPGMVADDAMEVDESAMLAEDVYDNEGSDYAMRFDGGNDAEATSIGTPPERPTEDDMGSGHNDW